MREHEAIWPLIGEASWEFAEGFSPLSNALREAWARSGELGLTGVSPAQGAALRMLAAMTQARAIVEIGTGTGLTALWMLQGLRADGQLTSIDVEGEHQRIAREVLASVDTPPGRVPAMVGSARRSAR